jgi:hypothetical protein
MRHMQQNIGTILSLLEDLHLNIDTITMNNLSQQEGELFLTTSYSNPSKYDFLRQSLKTYDDFISIATVEIR